MLSHIELTPKDKAKLLEMILILFPELNCIKCSALNFLYFRTKEGLPLRFHWFEFCITKIAPKLIDKGLSISFDGDYNPIPYLHSEFVKKQENATEKI
jgi:hypothetical protein